MKKLATAAAVVALLGVSATAFAWGGPWGNNGWGNNNNNWMNDMFGDGSGDFSMNMSGGGHGS
ncbi:MAG: sulfur globule family protein, partial [Chromatiaceae bacterium]